MVPSSCRKIVINGWYGHFNAGDDAILDVFVDQVSARLGCQIDVMSELPENIPDSDTVKGIYHPPAYLRGLLSTVVKGNFLQHMRALKSADMFVLGGGGLLRDNTSWHNLLRLLDDIWWAKLLGCKVMLYAIGVGPFKTRLGRYLIGKSASMCDIITVRSIKNAELLQELGIPAERIHVVADPAFLLKSETPKDAGLIKLLAGKKKIGVFPALGLVDDGKDFSYALKFAAALDNLVEKHGLQFVSLPMRVRESGLDDVQLSHRIKSAMRYPEAMEVYEKRLTPAELKWATSQTLLNITVRLHAMIFALGARSPVVAINYEPKVENVFAAFGCPEYLVEMDNHLDIHLTTAVEKALNNLPEYIQKISAALPQNEKSAMRTFELIESFYQREPNKLESRFL